MAKNELTLKLIKLDDAVALTWADNPKLHDSEEIIASLQKYGFQDPPKYDSALAAIIGGNGRIEALATMRDAGLEPVAGLALTNRCFDESDGHRHGAQPLAGTAGRPPRRSPGR